MKTTSKTILGFLTLGFALSTASAQSWAQSSAPEKPMKPHVLKILCERFPLNSRCPQGGAPAMSAPTGGGMTPAPDKASEKTPEKTPVPVGPSGGGALPPTTPSGGVTPSTPVPDAAGKPAGGGMVPPEAPSNTAPETAPKPSMPEMSPSKDKTPIPVGPSGGGDLPPTTPSGGVTPSTPVPNGGAKP